MSMISNLPIVYILFSLSFSTFPYSEVCNPFISNCDYTFDSTLKKDVYTIVSEEPSFPGGKAAFIRFILKEFKYPKSDSLQSTALANFVVDSDGKILKIQIFNPVDSKELSLFEKEYIRILSLMPKWVPGKCDGKNVATAVTHPIEVLLEEDNN